MKKTLYNKLLQIKKILNIIILLVGIYYAFSMNMIYLEASHTHKDIIAYYIIKLIKINDPYIILINELIVRTFMLPPCDFKTILQSCLNNPQILQDYLIHGKKFIDTHNYDLKQTVDHIIATINTNIEHKTIVDKENLEALNNLNMEKKQRIMVVILAIGCISITGIILYKFLP